MSAPFPGERIARAASEAHIRLAAPLFDAYRVFYRQPPDPGGSYRFLYERWVANESVLFIAFGENGAAIGFVHLYPLFLSDRMLRFWVLNDLFVTPEHRRSGAARALMQRAERHAAETGSAGLNLSTATDNVNAQALYESEGYVRDAEFVYYNKFLEPE
ncbi:MAG: N-acetyltransferase [Candidatus Eremiobacteraeota bacterium]|nr:N-acetyltransferase [Candidatus Eremiobacteraeota bacterium]